MRCCSTATARIFTLFSLAILLAQSFTLVNAQSSSDSSPSATNAAATGTDAPTSLSSSISSTPTDSVVPSPSPTDSQSVSASPSDSASLPASVSSSSQDVAPSNTASSSVAPDTSAPSTLPLTSSISSVAPANSSPAVSSSSSDLLSSSSSAAPATSTSVAPLPAAVVTSIKPPVSYAPPISSVNYAPATQGIVPEGSSGQGIQTVSGVVGAESTSAPSTSSKGFLENTPAMAGVFTVVGLIVVGSVLAVVLRIVRHRRRRYEDEDATYFEKDFSNGANFTDANNTNDDNQSITDVVTHAAPGAYPDRASHYGMPAFIDDTQPRDSIVEYAKGTAYATARAQAGPYQYSGQNDGYAGGFTNAHYQAQAIPDIYSSPDPYNIARAGGAHAAYGGEVDQQYRRDGEAY